MPDCSFLVFAGKTFYQVYPFLMAVISVLLSACHLTLGITQDHWKCFHCMCRIFMYKYFFIFRHTVFHSYLVLKLWHYLCLLSNAANVGLWLLYLRLILNVAQGRNQSQWCHLVSSAVLF